MLKQVKFYDSISQTYCGGLLLEDGSIVCGCCGALFKANFLKKYRINIVQVYEHWVNISAEIAGDDN